MTSESKDTQAYSSCAIAVFQGFPKIARFSREVVMTEKIDGTNAQVLVLEDGRVLAGSRTRFVTPEDDNHGFAAWVRDHEDELRKGLGPGRHFGEWWGKGINRGYGLDERRFSLFNTSRWTQDNQPACCHVVPVLGRTEGFERELLEEMLTYLRDGGSVAAPGFMRPEGVVLFHTAGNFCLKRTLEKDDAGKGSG